MPSGLVIYWLVSNLLAIGQQYLTNRMHRAAVRRGRPRRSRGHAAAVEVVTTAP